MAPQHKRVYGKLSLRGESVSAHRAMYEQEVGPIPEGWQIDHLCSVTRCINPSHMEPVTVIENMRRRPTTKLSIEIARIIRASQASQKELAHRFGVHQSAISNVRSGKSWRE